jgi:CRP/FNR family transcriptional regulator, cyclic AMP receptor protein
MQTMDRLESSIKKHPFLCGLNPLFYHFFNECAQWERFSSGQEIFHEGGNADRFFLIQNGSVALETFVPGCGMTRIQSLSAGDALGWSWLFPPHQWHFTATAMEPTELMVFDAAYLLEKTEENREFAGELLTRVAQILLERLQGTRMQLIDFYGMRP